MRGVSDLKDITWDHIQAEIAFVQMHVKRFNFKYACHAFRRELSH